MIADAVVPALAGFRAQAESLMVDTCTITRPGEPTTDPDTGEVVTPAPVVYAGRCKVQAGAVQERTDDVGQSVQTTQRYAVHVPVGAYEPAVGDVVTITIATQDANLVGRRHRVTALLHKSLATAYRLAVDEEV